MKDPSLQNFFPRPCNIYNSAFLQTRVIFSKTYKQKNLLCYAINCFLSLDFSAANFTFPSNLSLYPRNRNFFPNNTLEHDSDSQVQETSIHLVRKNNQRYFFSRRRSLSFVAVRKSARLAKEQTSPIPSRTIADSRRGTTDCK